MGLSIEESSIVLNNYIQEHQAEFSQSRLLPNLE